MIVGFVGCSGGRSNNKSTLANQKSDISVYENLMEMTVIAQSTNKKDKQEMENFLFYLPKSKYENIK
ncbi:hypothetical protein [Anaerorhabdus sp.]|uniref:hypothetical protein n=1 Tax=Anaerorhabdus sp. TaxID=1872524 RepID=UPI002FC5D9F4